MKAQHGSQFFAIWHIFVILFQLANSSNVYDEGKSNVTGKGALGKDPQQTSEEEFFHDETSPLKVAVRRLKSYVKSSIYQDEMTISGIQTGAQFAQAVHLSYSDMFKGLGFFSGSFYLCGEYSPNIFRFYSICGVPGGFPITGYETNLGAANVTKSIEAIKQYEREGLVSPLTNLRNQKLYFYYGTVDEFIPANVSVKFFDIYEPFLNSIYQVQSVIQYARHNFPTVSTGFPCTEVSNLMPDPFIGKCGYAGAFEMLNYLLSDFGFRLVRPAPSGIFAPKLEPLMEFSQRQFFRGIPEPVGLNDIGYIYVPRRCKRKVSTCHVHFYFHGCLVSKDTVGSLHASQTGFLEVAEENGIIVVFPQGKVTSFNMEGCFDSFGYTGSNYGNRNAKQIRVIKRMLDVFRK